MNKTMKNVTKIKTNNGAWGTPVAITVSELARRMKSLRERETVEQIALRAADARTAGRTNTALKGTDRLPYLLWHATFGRGGLHEFRALTGLLLLSIPLDGDANRTRQIRLAATQQPYTVMVFKGTSRRTLKVVVNCQPTVGQLPTTEADALTFLEAAQQQASRLYGALCQCSIPTVEESLRRGCRLSSDRDTYYNAKATALSVSLTPKTLTPYPMAVTDQRGHTTSDPADDDVRRCQQDYYLCVEQAMERAPLTAADPLSAERFVTTLAQLCRRSGLPEESSVRRTDNYQDWGLDLPTVRRIFRTVYGRQKEGRPWALMSEKERIARKVQDFFDRRYELRYNVLKQIEEFRPKGVDYHPWQPLTDRDIRRIAHEEMLEVGAAWSIDIELFCRSSIVKPYNPVHEFLAGCGRWDRRRDYIADLARRVPNSHPHWQRLFHRWLLGVVAAWTGRSQDFSNAVVPMLIGPQGCRKSTFCRLLLPRSLREYYIDDIKLDNAEQVERMLCRMALVNIDEYNAKTDREQAKIKRVLTERDVQVRRMRTDQYIMTQRMASFIATTNERQPLTDRTGSRRYLCVEVTGTIDTDTPINYQQLYAQALHELESGERYYMDHDEEQLMEQHNQQFMSLSTADILLTTYYEPAPRSQQHFVRAVDILADLQQHVKGADRPNMARLLKALKAAHFEYGAIDGVLGWYAKKRQ